MRHARILDVLSAVTAVATDHPEVDAWWYAPPRRLRLAGEIARARETPSLEVIVQVGPALRADCDGIAAELSRLLPGSPISVRVHRGDAEERQLFRLLSGQPRTGRDALERGVPEGAHPTA